MVIKKFEATSVEQALILVKSEFGPDALILSTEEKRGRFMQKAGVIVTAAYDKAKVDKIVDSFDEEELNQVFPHRMSVATESATVRLETARSKAPSPREIKSAPRGVPVDPTRYEPELRRAGFSDPASSEISRRLVLDFSTKDLQDAQFQKRAKQKLVGGYFRRFNEEPFSKPASWVAVGTPGVGKTSLLVKIAVQLKQQGKRVQLVSFDTRKLVGRPEMAAYAKTLDVPFTTENSVSMNADIFQLVDTPSFCSRDEAAMEELEQIARHRKVVVVLDASQRGKECLRVLEALQKLEPVAIAFTKVDLVEAPAVIFDVLRRAKLPVLGLSMNRSMKTGLKLLNVEQLADLMLTGNPPSVAK